MVDEYAYWSERESSRREKQLQGQSIVSEELRMQESSAKSEQLLQQEPETVCMWSPWQKGLETETVI